MNHIYRLKFDRRRNELVAVSEITAGAGKLKQGRDATRPESGPRLRRLALSALSGLMMLSLYPQMAGATLPTGGTITAGSGSISTTSSTQMDITQSSQNMIINWTTFNIGADSTVNFWQPDSSAVALNRVTGGTESQILGTLNANGQVFLVNPSGILFGSSARVNTAGFVASTRDISDEDFLKQCYTFSGNSGSGAAIINQGNLTTTKGGYIVLAADQVKNSGTLSTPGGSTVMAAAETVTLQLDNGGLTTVSVNGSVVNALVENSGLISARDGRVYLTARGKDMLLNTVLNVSGVVDAGSMSGEGGSIVLDGGDSGTVTISGSLQADSASGQGGRIVVQGDSILLDQGSSLSATGATGGGEVYVGGGWQGNDSSIRNASRVVMKDGATINVSATGEGDGGTAVLWSEDYTRFDGTIMATGGTVSGNGGQVETSSHNTLVVSGQVNAAAVNGSGGNWLLDPVDITIVDGSNNAADTNVSNTTADASVTLTGNGTGSSVTNTTIENSLNNGTSVTILTNGTDVSGQSGNITVNAAITKSNGSDASLTLLADGNITVNKNITSTNGALNVTLSAADSSDGSITLNGATISTSGGDITLNSANSSNSLTVNISGSTLNATNSSGSGGNITINATSNTTTANANVVYISSSNLTAGNNLSITGTATGCGAYGVTVNSSNLNADSVNITASAVNKAALYLLGNNTFTGINASTSSVGLTGVSDSSTGVWVQNNQTFSNTSSVVICGSATSGQAVTAAAGTTLNATSSHLVINGTSGNQTAVEWRGGNITAGDITITGNSGSGTGLNITNAGITANSGIYMAGGDISLTNLALTTTGSNGAVNVTGNNITLNSTNVTTNGGAITLSGGAGDSARIQVLNSALTSNGGDITLNRADGADNNALTVKVSNSTLNASASTGNAGDIVIDARNPDVNLNGSAYVNTVRNSGVLIEVSGNSTLAGGNITLTGTLNGSNATQMPVYLNGANLTAENNITLSGGADTRSGARIELRNTNNLTSLNGSILITNNVANYTAIWLNGTSTLSAQNGSVVIEGESNSSATQPAVCISGSAVITAKDVALTGRNSNAGAGLNITNTTLNVSNAASILGTSESGYGFVLANMTFSGGVADMNNVTLSSEGSGEGASNRIDGGVLTSEAMVEHVLNSSGITNDTLMNISAVSNLNLSTVLALINSNNTADDNGDIILNTTDATRNISWGFAGGNISVSGNLTLENAWLEDSNITAGGSATLNAASNLSLNGSSVTAVTGIEVTGDNISLTNLALTTTGSNGAVNVTGNNITLNGTNITTNGGAITLSGARDDTARIQVLNSNLTSNDGDIILNRAAGGDNNALTVLINASTLNATNSGGSAGNITVQAWNPDICLSASAYNSTVRNGGSMIQVSGNSVLNGDHITLTSTMNGTNAAQLPVFLCGTTITAAHDITLSGVSDDTANTARIEIRGANNSLTSVSGNIVITNNVAGSDPGVLVNATADSPVVLNAANGTVTMSGASSGNGTGLNITNANITANSASLTGVSETGNTGFTLTNVTFSGGVADMNNVTFSSEGSGEDASNWFNEGVLTSEAMVEHVVNSSGITNDTFMNLTAVTDLNLAYVLQLINSNNTLNGTDDLTVNFTDDEKGIIWGMSGGNLTVAGNLTLENAWSVAGMNLTSTNGSVTVSYEDSTANLTGTHITANTGIDVSGDDVILTNAALTTTGSNGAVNVTGNNITLNNANITTNGGDITLSGDAGNSSITVVNATLNATGDGSTPGNISITGAGNSSSAVVNITNTSLSAGNVTLTGNNSGTGTGLLVTRSEINVSNAASLTGKSDTGTGLNVTNLTLTANSASLTGVSDTGTALTLTNVTFSGNVANMTNVTISTEGSGNGAVSYFNTGVLKTEDMLNKVLNNSDITTYTVLNIAGISNYASGVNLSTALELLGYCNSGACNISDLTDSEGNLNLTSGYGNHAWELTNVNVEDISVNGSININGVGISNVNLTSTNGSISVNQQSNLTFTNNTISAAGNVVLTGGNLTLTNTAVNAAGDVTLDSSGTLTLNRSTVNSTDGDISINGTTVTLNNSTVAADAGNVSVSGNSTTASGVYLNNATITACESISIDGVTSALSVILSGRRYAGIEVAGNTTLKADTISMNGAYTGLGSSSEYYSGTAMSMYYAANLTLEGSSTVNLNSTQTGLWVYGKYISTPSTINVVNGSLVLTIDVNVSSNAGWGGGIIGDVWGGQTAAPSLIFNLTNADLLTNISVNGSTGLVGIGHPSTGNHLSRLIITGDGNATINAYSSNGTGIFASIFDNTGLNGSLVLNGSSTNGIGVLLESVDTSQTGNSTLVNATITGTSVTNVGVSINTTNDDTTLDLNGNNITGITETGNAAVLINGKNVTITNGSISGEVTGGNGSGVLLNGTGNYTVDGASVTGSSVNGTGVAVSGNLTATGASVSGSSEDGDGVSVSGNVSVEDSTLDGTSANGSGVSVSGNADISDATVTGASVDGSGVSVGGNATLSNATVSGEASGNGTGVSVTESASVTDSTVNGTSVDGSGVSVGGSAALSNATVSGEASGNGTGVTLTELASATDSVITGAAASGSGVSVEGDISLGNTSLSGDTVSGNGVSISGNLTGDADSTVTGNASGNGTGVTVSGSVTNGNVSGSSVSGSGVHVSGSIGNSVVRGDSVSGVGVYTEPGAVVTDSIVQGSSSQGLPVWNATGEDDTPSTFLSGILRRLAAIFPAEVRGDYVLKTAGLQPQDADTVMTITECTGQQVCTTSQQTVRRQGDTPAYGYGSDSDATPLSLVTPPETGKQP